RKHPSTVKKGCCNLMYLTEEESNGSTMALIRRLLSLARPLSSSPLIVGWADFRGDTGQREFSSYVAEARKRLIEDSSPDWIVLVQGILDSQPSHYALIKILLHTKAGTRARLEAVTSRRATSRRTLPAQRIRQGAVDLETEETRELLQSLEQLGAVAIENIPSTISRGYPCSIAALRNDPPLELRGSCDLLGTAEADAEKPTAILIRRVMAIAERASSSPMIQGWREYAGDTNVWRSVAPFKLLSSENGRGQVLDADWTITLTLYSVPHGGKKYVRVDLRETEPPLGGMISTNQPFECDPEVPRPRSERTKRDLHVNEARSLLKRLQKLEPCALITIPSTVVDGAPCTVTVLRRSKPSRQTAECNLMGLRDGRPGTETSGLILELLRLANAEAQ
ncbi:MAG TPA: hypothetical protein VFJ58_15550, partial [Armatimonadota bacterium]|nr:hypothetical protein [Armatimonadota bacterium]